MKINSTEVRSLDPIKVIAIHHVGEYSGISAEFLKIDEWANKIGYWEKGPRMIGIYHDNPMEVPAEKMRSSACLEDMGGTQPGEGMERYEVSGGKYLVMTAEVTMAEYEQAWCKTYAAMAEQGLECDARDHYELYIGAVDGTQGDDVPWVVEFRIPVK